MWVNAVKYVGFFLVVVSVLAFGLSLFQVQQQDYGAALLLVAMGASLLRAGTEFVRSGISEE